MSGMLRNRRYATTRLRSLELVQVMSFGVSTSIIKISFAVAPGI
jgi:hypothetical protein